MKSWSFRRKAIIVMTVGILLFVGGCLAGISEQEERIDLSRIAGTWTGDGGARVELSPDGRFEMSSIPREAIRFSFVAPPPGSGELSGSGTWEPAPHGEGDDVAFILLYIDVGGSFSDDSETVSLGVAQGGEEPVLYFSTSADRWYGFEVRKTS